MPSGSIPHGHERPDAAKRHTRTRKQVAPKVTAFPTLEQAERSWVMHKTLLDIVSLTRRYTHLALMDNAASGSGGKMPELAEVDALMTVAAFVALSKLPDTCPEIAGLITKTERLARLLHGDRGDA